jgi:outer membrane protein OmpA-like peptidoglycan-associated protein
MRGTLLRLTVLSVGATALLAQTEQQAAAPESALVTKSIKAIGYQVGGGSTQIDLKGTDLMPEASGEAKVEAKTGITTIEVNIKGLGSPTKLGTEFLTYVLWVVSPEGRASNVGEIIPNKSGEGKLNATTGLQSFSLFVTAEPYFSVRQPSEMVILENEIRKNTKGRIFVVNDYKLMRRAQYEKMGNPLALTLDLKSVPLEMYEARNAVEIAKSRAADRYAPDVFSKAQGSLQMAENSLASKANKKQTVSLARQTVQFSEDARALSVRRQEEERIASEREAAAAKAKADAEAEGKRKADEEAKRQAELTAAREAQYKAEQEAAAVKAKAEADALRAKEEAANADALRARQAAEALRAQLLEQFNRILETTDTPRGLVVNMADVLFATGKYDLQPVAREKLAKLSGIVLAHPGLNLAVEGHTDSTGSLEFNQKLSEQRAGTVRGYLLGQGLPPDSITAKGFGPTMPVADNNTPEGRQRNRRVEIIVSGEVIGTKIGK